jgi:intein/homing endonuclease
MVVVPEFSLPGGRCLCPSETVFFTDKNALFTYSDSLKNLHCIYKSGETVQILSHSDKTGNMVFAPITHMWESGIKDVYELKTKNGFSVRSSDEHLFYVNGKYIPLMNIKIGDKVITSDNHIVEESSVKSIKKIRGKEKMLDMEVYGTANLFANGIKCHNSRWFRYMFKGI